MRASEALKINNRPSTGCSAHLVCDGDTGDVLMLSRSGVDLGVFQASGIMNQLFG